MKNILPLFILFGLLTVSCKSELTVTNNDFDNDTSVDTTVDVEVLKDSGQQDLREQKDAATNDTADASDLGIDQNDSGSPIKGSAGCGVGEGIPEGENTFMLEGIERDYIMRLPEGYTNEKSWPIVLALHGNGSSATYWDRENGDYDIRSVLKNEAILISTHAIDNQWKDYNLDDAAILARLETELLYFEEILSQAKNKLCVNEKAIFAMGFSGGGSFSGVLGCRRPDIRAIAVGGSVIYFDEANCVSTPAAWITIGDGEQAAGRTAYRDFFRDRAGCEATSTATPPEPCQAYEQCDAATPVHYCQHAGAHVWPAIGSQAMWNFFKAFVEE